MSDRITTPKLRDVSAIRCDANGVADDGGAYFKISATIINRSEIPCTILCSYKQIPDGTGSGDITILSEDDPVPSNLETEALGGDLDAYESYSVSVSIIHDLGGGGTVIILPAAGVFMHKDGARNSISIGEKVTRDNAVSIAELIQLIVKGGLYLPDRTDPNHKVTVIDSPGIWVWDGIDSRGESRINAAHIYVGNGQTKYVEMAYDQENDRGYVFINDAPVNPTDATNKAYVDAKINALRKELGLEEE